MTVPPDEGMKLTNFSAPPILVPQAAACDQVVRGQRPLLIRSRPTASSAFRLLMLWRALIGGLI
jgi:hypothetical protein